LQLLTVKFRAWLDIDPIPIFIDDSRDVFTSFADCGRNIFVINKYDSFVSLIICTSTKPSV